jgi:hypothetical protein
MPSRKQPEQSGGELASPPAATNWQRIKVGRNAKNAERLEAITADLTPFRGRLISLDR